MAHLIIKILIFIVNFVLWASGILLIVFGGLALGDPVVIINLLSLISGVAVVTNLINVYPLFEGLAIFMCVLGSLLFLFGGIGCHGAFTMHKRMIMNYWIMLILGVLTEIALIIYGAENPYSEVSYIQTSLHTSLVSGFQPVSINAGLVTYSSNTTAASWEMLQSQTKCCGAYSSLDYMNFTNSYWEYVSGSQEVPPTCCQTSLSSGTNITSITQFLNLNLCQDTGSPAYTYTSGCYNNVVEMVWQFNYIAIIIASCLMATQLIGIVLTVHHWHRMVRDDGGKI